MAEAARVLVEPSTVRVTEVFHSLQGETSLTGLPTVFIRLTGCPLRCHYCDTGYAFSGGTTRSLNELLDEVEKYETPHITVTGGEPLAQKSCRGLLEELCNADYQVSLETSGAMDISGVDKRVVRVVDIKTPGSGEENRNLYSNIEFLLPHDQLKFVICDRYDYEWAAKILHKESLAARCEVLFSPVAEELQPATLANWILEDRLPVRFQIQLHKYLWGDVAGK
jgi:7-carboxy-7-deazaguanine synthase